MVASAGLRPVARLTQAAERVARTDDLRPIPVAGNDELARLTEAFNMMLRALAESRERQARLVADAGHELRTPLTSMRTNVELLIESMKPGAPRLPEEDMIELRTDVIGQIEELSRSSVLPVCATPTPTPTPPPSSPNAESTSCSSNRAPASAGG